MKSKTRADCTRILSDSYKVVYRSFSFYEVRKDFFHLNVSLRNRCLFLSSEPRMKENKDLHKEWAVVWQRAIKVHFKWLRR